MKVLWVCNIMLPVIAEALGEEYSVREGWLSGILHRFLKQKEDGSLTLGICFPGQGKQEDLTRELVLGEGQRRIACFGFSEDLTRPESYQPKMEQRFREILEDFGPDLVHIFGTEFPHAYACAKVWNRPDKTLVGIQGVCSACAQHYMADLPERVQKSKTLRDVLRKDSLAEQQQKFYARAQREKKTLQLADHITGRTEFDRAAALKMNSLASYHFMNETMRSTFYEGSWDLRKCNRYEIFVSQADYPLKGFHYLLQAMPEIIKSCPEAHITVAGNSILGMGSLAGRLKIPAYGQYLRSLIGKYHLEKRIRVLGRLNEEEMKQAYLSSHVFLCPSAVENSPNSVAEAQLLGVPVVASRAGGIPSIVEDGVSGLLFEKGNAHELAQAVLKIFVSGDLARQLSAKERSMAAVKYDGERNYRVLMAIYGELL